MNLFTLLMEKRNSETSVLTTAKWRYIQEDGILRSHRSECLKSSTALTGCSGEGMFLVKYELGFYMQEDGTLHSNRREKLKCYKKFVCSRPLFRQHQNNGFSFK
jgi:hypothetical protein